MFWEQLVGGDAQVHVLSCMSWGDPEVCLEGYQMQALTLPSQHHLQCKDGRGHPVLREPPRETPLPWGWASDFARPRSAMKYVLWSELERLQASVFGKNEDWERWRRGPLLLPAAGWLAREGFIVLATFGMQTAQNSHPFYTSKWAATGDSFVSWPTFFLKFPSPLYCKG